MASLSIKEFPHNEYVFMFTIIMTNVSGSFHTNEETFRKGPQSCSFWTGLRRLEIHVASQLLPISTSNQQPVLHFRKRPRVVIDHVPNAV